MLLLMLGGVIALMAQLERPATVEHLRRVFGEPPLANETLEAPGRTAVTGEAAAEAVAANVGQPASGGPWEKVKDNALFLPAEEEAWFLLWDEAIRRGPAEFEQRAAPVTYAQLVNQPNIYRGLPVQVRGRVLRESIKRAPENSLGIAEYHQLVLAPIGGGDWPVIIYCLDLPVGFPRGDGLKEDMDVVGMFFKNWSYPYEGGMGLAPVLVTKALKWTPKTKPPVREQAVDDANVGWLASAAVIAVVGFLAWVLRQTRRRSAALPAAPDFTPLEVEP
jgi:hypothetical protein